MAPWRLRQIGRGEPLRRFGEPGRDQEAFPNRPVAPTRIAFHPDGRRIAAANARRPLELWDIESGRVVLILDIDGEGFTSAAWSSDGQRLAGASGRRVKIWNATTRGVEERRRDTESDSLDWHRNEVPFAIWRWDWFSANYHLSRLIAAQSGDSEHYIARAAARVNLAGAGRGRLQDAAADLGKAIELGSENPEIWYQRALVTLADHRPEQYRADCRAMFEHFAKTTDLRTNYFTVRTATIAADAGIDPGQALELANRGLGSSPRALPRSATSPSAYSVPEIWRARWLALARAAWRFAISTAMSGTFLSGDDPSPTRRIRRSYPPARSSTSNFGPDQHLPTAARCAGPTLVGGAPGIATAATRSDRLDSANEHAAERPTSPALAAPPRFQFLRFFCWSRPPRDSMLIVVGSGARNEDHDSTCGAVSANRKSELRVRNRRCFVTAVAIVRFSRALESTGW